MPSVPFRSAVGTMRMCGNVSDRPSQPITRVGRSTGIKSSAFMSATHTNTVRASGAMKRRLPWTIDFDWSSTISTSISIAHWKRPGTPEVALRAASPRIRIVARPQRIDQKSVSRFQTWISKIDVCEDVERFCKWCAMYSDGSIACVPSLAAITLKPPKLTKIFRRPRDPRSTLSWAVRRARARVQETDSARINLLCYRWYVTYLPRQGYEASYVAHLVVHLVHLAHHAARLTSKPSRSSTSLTRSGTSPAAAPTARL